MRQAAEILKGEGYKVSPNTISRLANRNIIQTKDDPIDARVRLVELDELRRLLADHDNSDEDNE